MVRRLSLPLLATVLIFSGAIHASPRSDLKVSDLKLKPGVSLNPDLLAIKDILPLGDHFRITDAVKTKGISLDIKYPIDLFSSSLSFREKSTKVLQTSLPQILQQFNVPADQIQARVEQGIPLLINGLQGLLSNDPAAHSHLQRRNILDTLGRWAKDAGCALVASGLLPLFLLAAADFTASNTDVTSISPEQEFFLYPIWGNLAHGGPVKIFYQATRAPFFKGAAGTTFNRNIFTPLVNIPSFSEDNHLDFENLVQLLIHEFAHVDQYRRWGYDITAFGYEYLFQWCTKGGYDKITLEVEAKATEHRVDSLLLFRWGNQRGNEFFQVWRTRNLGPLLGFPIAQTYTDIPGGSIRELRFQRGALQIQDGPCFRTFTNGEIAAREMSTCSTNPTCQARRDARPPTDPPRDGEPDPGPRFRCSAEEKAELLKACRDAKGTWGAVRNRAWTCNLGLPTPPPPPPPPKPGCPPDCDIIRKIPITSKPCRFDEPPLGCFHGQAETGNRECRARMDNCKTP